MDILTYVLSKKYTDKVVTSLAGGMQYKGSKPTVADLPTPSESIKGHLYTVTENGHEYVCDGKEWVDLSKDLENKADKTELAAEILARSSADTDLQNNITTEANSRTSADNALQEGINQEAIAREQADTTLQSNIDSKAALPSELPPELKVPGVDYPWFMINMEPKGIDADGNLRLDHSGYNFNTKQYYTWTDKVIPMAATETTGGVMTAADKVKLNKAITEHQDISGKLNVLPNVDDPEDPGYNWPYHIPYNFETVPESGKLRIILKTLTLDNKVTKMDFEKVLPGATIETAGLMTASDKQSLANKQDMLTAGANIKLDGSVISVEVESVELTGTSGTLTDEQATLLNNSLTVISLNNKCFRLSKVLAGSREVAATYVCAVDTSADYITVGLIGKFWEYHAVELQGKLTAGENITIRDNVISATSGGTTVIANPELKGNEDELNSIQIGDTVYSNLNYHPFPEEFVTNKTLKEFGQSIVNYAGFATGCTWFGGIECTDLPGNMIQVECKVTALRDKITWARNIACVEIYSSEVAPFYWHYNTDSWSEGTGIDDWKYVASIDGSKFSSTASIGDDYLVKVKKVSAAAGSTGWEFYTEKGSGGGEPAEYLLSAEVDENNNLKINNKLGQEVVNCSVNYTLDNAKVKAVLTEAEKETLLSGVTGTTWIKAQTDISSLQSGKQDKLTAGTNITISADNVISATGTGGTTNFNELTNRPSYNGLAMTGLTSIPEVKTATWDAKQDAISDLDTIRAGAALGATAIQEHQDISGKLNVLPKVDDPTDPGYGWEYHIPYRFDFTTDAEKLNVKLHTLTLDNKLTKMKFDSSVPSATSTNAGLMSAADKVLVDTISSKADLPSELPPELKVPGVDYPWFMINMNPKSIDAQGQLHLDHSGYNFNTKQYYTWTDKVIPMAATETTGGLMTAADKVKLNAAITEHQDISGKLNVLPKVDDPTDPGYGWEYHIPYRFDFALDESKLDVTLHTLTLDNKLTKMQFNSSIPAATQSKAGLMSATDKKAVDEMLPEYPTDTSAEYVLALKYENGAWKKYWKETVNKSDVVDSGMVDYMVIKQ